MSKTLFQKIADREIPADILYETEYSLAFRDVKPQAPVHVLLVPKHPHARLAEVPETEGILLGKLLQDVQRVAKQLGVVEGGFRVVINNGPNGGESVPHLHIHLLAGRALGWPPG
jgi:histidine triad (HIT) family protein